MNRRRFVVLGSGCIGLLAGCIGGSSGESLDGEVVNNVDQLEVSETGTSIEQTAYRDETLLVTGMLENTGDDTVDVDVVAEFEADDGVSLGTIEQYIGTSGAADPIPPDTRVEFRVGYNDGPPDEVAEYTLTVGPDYEQGNASETTSGSEESTTEDTETSTTVEESFHDGWEDGSYTESPVWVTNNHGGGDSVSVDIKEHDAPDGGSHSLSLYSDTQKVAGVYTHDEFRFDAPWTVEGLVQFYIGTNDYGARNLDERIYVSTEMGRQVDVSLNCILDSGNRRGSVSLSVRGSDGVSENLDVMWEDGTWYRYRLQHDGEGLYQLKFWADEDDEPDAFQISFSGAVPQTGESKTKQLGIRHFAGNSTDGPIANHAFISYSTDDQD